MCKKIMIMVVLSLLVVFGSSAIAVEPIHYWSMEEGIGKISRSADGETTENTGSESGHDGTIYGLAWAPGLNGTGSCLDHERKSWGEAVDIPTFSGDITGSFTVEAWIKAESWPESWQGAIFSNLYDNGTNRTGFELRAGARNDQGGMGPD